MRGPAPALPTDLFGFFMPPLRLHPIARIWEQMRAGQGQGGVLWSRGGLHGKVRWQDAH
jgi:hypothetical protein